MTRIRHSLFWEGLAGIGILLPRERYLMGYPDGGGKIWDGYTGPSFWGSWFPRGAA